MEKSELVKVAVVLTGFEAGVILRLREFNFGEMVIKKKDGTPYQVIVSKSSIIRCKDGLDLKDGLAIPQGSELSSQEYLTEGDIDKFFKKQTHAKKEK